ncbi:MAG TPA: TVP38/TMEM64 family protein [Chthoniobacterales bacterium]|nr:TVP38/TMEM64 family protein [Chthoniobacterales bacterium]
MLQIRRAIIVQLAGLTVVGLALFFLSRLFPLVDILADVQQHVMGWGAWSAIWYPLLYACCNVLLLPGGVLSVGAGFFFGLWWGFFIALAGNVSGAAISFFISRTIGRQWLKRKLSRNATMVALEPAVEKEGWKIILLSQLHPLFPTSLLNYLYGLTQIRFRTCMLWVAIGQAPGLFLYSYLGTLGQLGLNLARGKTHPKMLEYWVWIGGFVSAAIILIILGRIALTLLKKAQSDAISISQLEPPQEFHHRPVYVSTHEK